MLDVLIPSPASNASLVPECIESFARCTDIPFSLVVIMDGGVREDFGELEAFLHRYEGQWNLLHNPVPIGLNRSLNEGIEACHGKLIAVAGPQVRMDDRQWFGKAQAVFFRDPAAMVVDTVPNTRSTTLVPVKRAHSNPPARGCRMAMLRASFVRQAPLYGAVDPVEAWSRSATKMGGFTWAVESIRYNVTEHKEHKLWSAPLDQPARSE